MPLSSLALEMQEQLREAYLERGWSEYVRDQFDVFGQKEAVDRALGELTAAGYVALSAQVICDNGHDMGEVALRDVGRLLAERCPVCEERAAESVFLKIHLTGDWRGTLDPSKKKPVARRFA